MKDFQLTLLETVQLFREDKWSSEAEAQWLKEDYDYK